MDISKNNHEYSLGISSFPIRFTALIVCFSGIILRNLRYGETSSRSWIIVGTIIATNAKSRSEVGGNSEGSAVKRASSTIDYTTSNRKLNLLI